jgi:Lipase (class 3)
MIPSSIRFTPDPKRFSARRAPGVRASPPIANHVEGEDAMNFSAADAYQLCNWLDTQTSFPPSAPPPGWSIVFKPEFLKGNYAVILESATDSSQLAVVILGTHDVVQMIQDIDISTAVPFENSSGVSIIDGALIAKGAMDVFDEVLKLKPLLHEQTFEDFLTSVDWTSHSVLVTGHSLGGTTASLVAPWLATLALKEAPVTAPLPAQIQAVTFAAFAGGNQELADYLNGSAQYVPNINVNDIVPYVWATTGDYEVSSIYKTFASPGPPMPHNLKHRLRDKVKQIPSGFNYIQTNEPNTFAGTILAAPSFSTCGDAKKIEDLQWTWEVGLQHNYAYCVQYIGSGCKEPSSDCPQKS